MDTINIPKFVKLNNSALRLRGKTYWRDGGEWGVTYRIIDGVLVSWKFGFDMPHLHKVPLIEITEEEWRKSNCQYAPEL